MNNKIDLQASSSYSSILTSRNVLLHCGFSSVKQIPTFIGTTYRATYKTKK